MQTVYMIRRPDDPCGPSEVEYIFTTEQAAKECLEYQRTVETDAVNWYIEEKDMDEDYKKPSRMYRAYCKIHNGQNSYSVSTSGVWDGDVEKIDVWGGHIQGFIGAIIFLKAASIADALEKAPPKFERWLEERKNV